MLNYLYSPISMRIVLVLVLAISARLMWSSALEEKPIGTPISRAVPIVKMPVKAKLAKAGALQRGSKSLWRNKKWPLLFRLCQLYWTKFLSGRRSCRQLLGQFYHWTMGSCQWSLTNFHSFPVTSKLYCHSPYNSPTCFKGRHSCAIFWRSNVGGRSWQGFLGKPRSGITNLSSKSLWSLLRVLNRKKQHSVQQFFSAYLLHSLILFSSFGPWDTQCIGR